MARAIAKQTDEKTGITVFEPNDWSSRVTLDILGEAGMGTDFRAIADPDNEVTSAYRSLFEQDWKDIVFAIAEIAFPQGLVMKIP